MGDLERIKDDSPLERHWAAKALEADGSSQATDALIQALSDPGVGEWPGDYDAPPFLYPVAQAAAESLLGRAERHLVAIMQATRSSQTAAYYVARLLGQLGKAGVEPLLELCRHPSAEVRSQAVYSLRPQYDRCGDSRLIIQLLQMLIDPEASVTYYAIGEVKQLTQDLQGMAPPRLIEDLMARCLAHPQASTFSEALEFFATDPSVFDFLVDQAAAGSERPCSLLRSDLNRLSQAQLKRLCGGHLSTSLIKLLGALGERAVEAAPRLLQLVDQNQEAVLALLSMPSQQARVLDYLPHIYLTSPPARSLILRLHPDKKSLALLVVPSLALQAQKLDGAAFRGLEMFGPLAASEARWLIRMVNFSTPDYFRDSAVELLGTFGETARAAFPSFAKFLKYPDTRKAVLKALVTLGPVAAEFKASLEAIKSELGKDEERDLVDQALAALQA